MEAYQLLDLAFNKIKGPVAIRYSNQSLEFDYAERYAFPEITFGSWVQLKDQGKINLITYGDNVRRMQSLIEKSQLPINLFNARFIKPLDETLLEAITSNPMKTFVLEDVTTISGLGSAILEFLHTKKIDSSQIEIIGLPDAYIDQGKVTELYKKYGMDDESLLLRFTEALK
jgi:1-deoxy-D-xylulose-5-phosphate synthase